MHDEICPAGCTSQMIKIIVITENIKKAIRFVDKFNPPLVAGFL